MTSSVPRCLDSTNIGKQRKFLRFLMLFGACTFILIVVVLEIFIIFPKVFEGLAFYLNWAFAIFIVFNMIGNLIAFYQVDTSISIIEQKIAAGLENRDTWQFCEKCGVMTPPQSRHCNKCDICILKKVHHCYFTGYCVGHYNYRYFMAFIGHVVIATAYATFINLIYFWWIYPQIYFNVHRILCFVFPGYIFFQWTWDNTDLSFDWNCLHIILFQINVATFFTVGFILHFHIQNLKTGANCYAKLQTVFGENLYRAFLWPFIKNKSPHDGIDWSPVLDEVAIKKL